MSTAAVKAQISAKFSESMGRLTRREPMHGEAPVSSRAGSDVVDGLLTWSQAWKTANEYLKPRDLRARETGRMNFDEARTAFHIIAGCRQISLLLESFLDQVMDAFPLVDAEIAEHIAQYTTASNSRVPDSDHDVLPPTSPDSPTHRRSRSRTGDPETHAPLPQHLLPIRVLTTRLLSYFKAWAPPPQLGPVVAQAYTLAFQTRLYSSLPPEWLRGFREICLWSLDPDATQDKEEINLDTANQDESEENDVWGDGSVTYEEDTEGEEDVDADVSMNLDNLPDRATPFNAPPAATESMQPTASMTPHPSLSSPSLIWRDFFQLGMITRYESVISSVGYSYISSHITRSCLGQWEKSMLGELREWMSVRVVPWLLSIYARSAGSTEEARGLLQGVGSRFDWWMCRVLGNVRTKEIFDIIVDYPDSMGALLDLKEVLHRTSTQGHAHLIATLRAQNNKRLLHPGADTKTILSQYVSMIKCLRVVDPVGVVCWKVGRDVRRYLRDRPDTIRSIVASLVGDEDSGDSLLDEGETVGPLQQVEADDYSDPNWEPEPVDAGPEFRTNRPSDIISTLVSIYDSKDLFVKELQVLLAQRLLAITDGDVAKVDRERKNIEILKIRFGEAALQVCEVMLRDMSDSRRIDAHVQSASPSVLKPTVISKHFWPILEASEMNMPGQFQALQDHYAAQFRLFKPDKKLKWLPQLGTVELKLELEDRTIEVVVKPLEAGLIELFSQKDTWTLDDILHVIGNVDRVTALQALATWVNMGVLKEAEENVFVLLERKEEGGDGERETMVPVASSSSAQGIAPVQSVQQQQAEKMRVYWKFIEGMLKNLGRLPLDRIQTMLKLAPGYDQTIEQLGAFMDAAKREGLVVVNDGFWRLAS